MIFGIIEVKIEITWYVTLMTIKIIALKVLNFLLIFNHILKLCIDSI